MTTDEILAAAAELGQTLYLDPSGQPRMRGPSDRGRVVLARLMAIPSAREQVVSHLREGIAEYEVLFPGTGHVSRLLPGRKPAQAEGGAKFFRRGGEWVPIPGRVWPTPEPFDWSATIARMRSIRESNSSPP